MLKLIKSAIVKTKGWYLIYWLISWLYAFFSYGLAAPNLWLSQNQIYVKFQQFMWLHLFNNRPLLAIIYGLLIGLLFLSYILIIKNIKNWSLSLKDKFLLLIPLIIPLIFSYNALSFDVFNYIFNSRMIVRYSANPHLQTATNFSFDLWTRFMHNTHTPAPYGYGWTLLSLIPYLFGLGKFSLTWLSFRLWSTLSVLILIWVIDRLYQLIYHQPLKTSAWCLLFLNPLFLIEIVSNSHNDLWMIIPAMLSFMIILHPKIKNFKLKILLSACLIIFSISTKYASLALVPIWLILLIKPLKNNFFKIIRKKFTLIASMLMFLPLLIPRSQQFLPWYLIWSLAWLPLIDSKKWSRVLLIFSLTSMLRYLPWLLTGEYSSLALTQQKIITWSALIFIFIDQLVVKIKSKSNRLKLGRKL